MKSTEHETVKNIYQPDILIIDDDPTMSRILSMVLIKAGYAVRSATTARNGLNDALRKTPDAILLDYMLPDRSGLELLADFRNSIDLENVPVIMLTASSETSIVRTAIVSGVNDYLLKPVEPETLLIRLEALLGNRALSQLNQEENLKVEKEEVQEPLQDQENSADPAANPEKNTSDQTEE